ncbi:thermonuclease family protein [Paenibacillus durus]|uniref:thermonuclease family protein n=1 Tax=Paenibacillus durus TaxID=44251 RepID=UPI000694D2BC|nr:thermonuclease family protein [Paenibacillus durus]
MKTLNPYFKKLLILLLFTMSVLWYAPFHVRADESGHLYETVIQKVVDGDTVHLKDKVLGTTKVRLLSIDAPETNFSGESQGDIAIESAAYLQSLLPRGTKVKLSVGEEEKDRYGRLLAHIYKDDVDINEEMLKKGHAVTYFIWPNITKLEQYQKTMLQAKNTKLGMWKTPDLELPFEFRARVSDENPSKYVGDFTMKTYVNPDQYKQVAVEKRVFFFTEQAALRAGYTKIQ